MTTDVFCKIIRGELPSEVVYKDDNVWVIKDITPQAPVHLLIITAKHFDGLDDVVEKDQDLLGKLFLVAHDVAKKEKLDKGYRLVVNEGEHGGKLVPHFHIHLLGGKPLGPKIIK